MLRLITICLVVSVSHSAVVQAAVDLRPNREDSNCRVIATAQNLELQSCNTIDENQRWMKLIANDQRRDLSRTVVNATFAANQKIWDRIWISRGEGRLNPSEQKTLQTWVSQPTSELQASGFLPLLDVLGNFLKPGTRLENFDRVRAPNTSTNRFDSNAFGTWTPICEDIGTTRVASFTLSGNRPGDAMHVPQLIELPVGEPATLCRGRCGWGCAQNGPQLRKNQYTQECFNHDACNWTHHEQLGVCADAFWAAAASYAFAPNCPNHIGP